MSHVHQASREASWPAVVCGKTYRTLHASFSVNFFILALPIDIDFYHDMMSLFLTLTLAWDHKVSAK